MRALEWAVQWWNPLQSKSEFCPVPKGISVYKKGRGRAWLFASGCREGLRSHCGCTVAWGRSGVLGVGVENTYFLAMIFEILSLGASPEYWVSWSCVSDLQKGVNVPRWTGLSKNRRVLFLCQMISKFKALYCQSRPSKCKESCKLMILVATWREDGAVEGRGGWWALHSVILRLFSIQTPINVFID